MNFSNESRSRVCYQPVQGPLNRDLYEFLFPLILFLAVFGNIANVIVYYHPFLRKSTTVRVLSFKAMANMFAILCMVPTWLYSYPYDGRDFLGPRARRAAYADDKFAAFYWLSLRYALFGTNFFGMISVWLTVAVTLEHFLLVALPIKGRAWTTIKKAYMGIVTISIISFLLHLHQIIAFVVKVGHPNPLKDPCLPNFTRYYYVNKDYAYRGKPPGPYTVYASVYLWACAFLVMFIPLCLLLFLTGGLYWKLFYQQKFTSRSEHKQCVIRLAMATTVCHLIFEMPGVIVFVLAAIFGSTGGSWSYQEEMHACTNFLSYTNAAIPFVVYALCSERFRHIAIDTFMPKSISRRFVEDRTLHQADHTIRSPALTALKSTKETNSNIKVNKVNAQVVRKGEAVNDDELAELNPDTDDTQKENSSL